MELVRQPMSPQKANESAQPWALKRRPQEVKWLAENVQTAQTKLSANSNRFHMIRE